MEIIVDARGQLCPKPLILTKKQLVASKEGDTFTVLIDNETAKENVERFLGDNGVTFSVKEDDATFAILVTKNEGELNRPNAEAYCPLPTSSSTPTPSSNMPERGYAFCFKSDKMGSGDDDLGGILVKACINTIEEMEQLPEAIVFYNSGVKLVLEDAGVVPSLQKLEKAGVKILVCGTCADFFSIRDQAKVGIISNMYDILEVLTSANHVVTP